MFSILILVYGLQSVNDIVIKKKGDWPIEDSPECKNVSFVMNLEEPWTLFDNVERRLQTNLHKSIKKLKSWKIIIIFSHSIFFCIFKDFIFWVFLLKKPVYTLESLIQSDNKEIKLKWTKLDITRYAWWKRKKTS